MKGFSYLSSCFRFLLLLLTAGFFVSCDNFLEGSDLKKELESEIDYANSDKAVLTIYVTSADFGTVYPSSFTGARGEKVTIEFTQKAGTEYVKWDYLGGTADGIVFSDEVNPAEPDSFGVYHRKVTVTINDPRYNYKVFPRCYAAEYNMPELDSETVAVYSTQDEDKWYYKKLIAADYDRWSIGDEDSFLGKCRQNYSNSLHVSMTGRDDSGIRGVCVEENRVMTSEAVAVYEAGVKSSFYECSRLLRYDEETSQPVYECAFDYEFQHKEDGLFALTFYLEDYNGNQSNYVRYYVIKNTSLTCTGDVSTLKTLSLDQKGFDFDWSRFKLNFSSFYKNYVSQKKLTVYMSEDDGEKQVLIDGVIISSDDEIPALFKNSLEGRTRDRSKTTYFDFSFEDESSSVYDIEFCIPKAADAVESGVLTSGKYGVTASDISYTVPNMSSGAQRQSLIFYYTYQADKNAQSGDFVKINEVKIDEYINEDNFYCNYTDKLKDKADGIYKIYIQRGVNFSFEQSGVYTYAPLGKPFVYYKGIESSAVDGNFVFPEFFVPEINADSPRYGECDPDGEGCRTIIYMSEDFDRQIVFERNTGTARFSVKTELPDDGITYVAKAMRLDTMESSGIYKRAFFFDDMNIEVPCGFKYDIFLVAMDSEGNFIAESEPLELNLSYTVTGIDNFTPVITLQSNPGVSVYDYSYLRLNAEIKDRTTKESTYGGIEDGDITCFFMSSYPGTQVSKSWLEANCEYSVTSSFSTSNLNTDFLLYGLNYGTYYPVFVFYDKSEDFENYGIQSVNHKISWYYYDSAATFSDDNGSFKMEMNRPSDSADTDSSEILSALASLPAVYVSRLEDGKWVQDSGYTLMENDPVSGGFSLELDYSQKNLTGTFVRLNAVSGDGIQAVPCIVYPDYYRLRGTQNEITSDSKGMLRISNGWQIFTDSPVFVQTVYSRTNLSESYLYAGMSDEQKAALWEKYGQTTGFKCMSRDFTYTDSNAQSISPAFFYVTAVHFADGTVLVSEVRQREAM